MLEKISAIRSKVHETFGKVALAMMALPRYRHQSVGDLNHILLEPLIRDRVAIASTKPDEKNNLDTLTGIAIWLVFQKRLMKKFVSKSRLAYFLYDCRQMIG